MASRSPPPRSRCVRGRRSGLRRGCRAACRWPRQSRRRGMSVRRRAVRRRRGPARSTRWRTRTRPRRAGRGSGSRVRSGVPPTASKLRCSRRALATLVSQPGYQAGRAGAVLSASRSASRNCCFCGQSLLTMTIWAAMQLKPLLCRRWVATCSAWKRRSAFDQLPGTTMVGATPPSSLVIGLVSRGVPAAFAAAPWSRRSPDDCVVGGFAAGDVYGVDAWVGARWCRARRRR